MVRSKKFLNNLFNLGSVEIIGMMIPIITMPLLTRVLGGELYGTYLYLLTFVLFGNTIIDFGTRFVSVRQVSNLKNNKKSLYNLYRETQSLRLMLALIYITIVFTFFIIFDSNSDFYTIAALIIPYCLGYSLIPTWYYHGLNKLKIITISQLLIKLVNLVFIVFFLDGKDCFIYLILSYSLPVFMLGLYFIYYVNKKDEIKFIPTFKVYTQFKNNLSVFIGLLAPNMYNILPTIALGTIYPPEEFAMFAIAIRLCSVVVIIQNVVSRALYPILIQEAVVNMKKLFGLYTYISVPLIAGITLFGAEIMAIFLGEIYSGVSKYLIILSVGVLFLGWTNALSQGYFLVNGLDQIYRNVSLRVSVVSCFLSILLISQLGIIGGALSITCARLLFLLDYSFVYKYTLKHN